MKLGQFIKKPKGQPGYLMRMAHRVLAGSCQSKDGLQSLIRRKIVGGRLGGSRFSGFTLERDIPLREKVISFAIAESDRFEIMVCLIPRRKDSA
jgi:hypothetical protein